MRLHVPAIAGLLAMSLQVAVWGQTTGKPLPLKNGRPVVAVVGQDAIYLDELLRERGPSGNRATLLQGRGTAEDLEMVERLITIKLIAQEATTMGLGEIPEIERQVEVTSREILREVLMERLTRHLVPNAAEVERLFRDAVREWKTTSLIFKEEAAAARVQKELASGAPFAEVSKRLVSSKTAEVDSDNAFHARSEFLPQIADAIAKLKVGQVSPVLRLQMGFVVIKVVDVRYPANAEARAEARRQVLSQQQVAFLQAHEKDMRRQYVVVNKKLLDSINYEAAKPTMEELLKDKRVVAEVKGGASVTVGDLTDYLRMQFFHGADQAAQKRKMNGKKTEALDATLGRRLLNMEAVKLGIDKTNAYRDRVTGYRESLVFDSFVQKVIAPENKVTEPEVKKYYDSHLKDYSFPGMYRVRSLAFVRRNAAEEAIRKLREGTDFNWLAANADGRAPKGAPGLLTFDGKPVTTESMPDGLQKTLAGAKPGEFKLYASPEGHFYALVVQQVVGSTAKPFAEVKDEAARKLYGEKIKKGVEAYAAKLRAKTKVETYLVKGR